jgi:tRNA 2-thiouridine synthesizing protein A
VEADRDEAMAERRFDVFLDARGLACPMPPIKARRALMVVDKGATICVLATDPASEADFENSARRPGTGS